MRPSAARIYVGMARRRLTRLFTQDSLRCATRPPGVSQHAGAVGWSRARYVSQTSAKGSPLARDIRPSRRPFGQFYPVRLIAVPLRWCHTSVVKFRQVEKEPASPRRSDDSVASLLYQCLPPSMQSRKHTPSTQRAPRGPPRSLPESLLSRSRDGRSHSISSAASGMVVRGCLDPDKLGAYPIPTLFPPAMS